MAFSKIKELSREFGTPQPTVNAFARHLMRVDAWTERGKLRRAEAHLAQVLTTPLDIWQRARLLVRRARIRLYLGRPEEAADDLRSAVAAAPELLDQAEARALRGDIALGLFEATPVGFADRALTDAAMDDYGAVLDQHPTYDNLGWVLYQWGRILLSRGLADEARAKFEVALSKRATVRVAQAYCCERIGFLCFTEYRDTEAALRWLSQAAATYPKDAPGSWLVQTHLLRSRVFQEQGQPELAAAAARTALAAISPLDADYRNSQIAAHLAIGQILAEAEGSEREAVEHLTQFFQLSRRPAGIDVTWSRAYELLGELFFRLEQYQKAIEAYRASLGYNPYHPWEVQICYQIARCYYRLSDFSRAADTVQKMIHIAEAEGQIVSDYRVYSLLGNALFMTERYVNAADALATAIRFAPDASEAQSELLGTYETACGRASVE